MDVQGVVRKAESRSCPIPRRVHYIVDEEPQDDNRNGDLIRVERSRGANCHKQMIVLWIHADDGLEAHDE